MANIRNQRQNPIVNDSEYYKELYERRGLKKITHYPTARLNHPTVSDRANINTVGHIWAYGDRFYKLAHQYYGDVNFWWVIAWWNGYPTEVSVQTGDFLDIPLDIGAALDALGV
tara:strand:+ start:68 stop:409 length:342 start_codon:yes stop_codon:yes gene_type:complete